MQSDFTHFFLLIPILNFPPEAVLDLIKFDKDVTCCSCAKKSYNWKRLIYSMQNNSESKESLDSRGLDFAYNAIYNKEKN